MMRNKRIKVAKLGEVPTSKGTRTLKLKEKE
jgi:hypothetical protein